MYSSQRSLGRKCDNVKEKPKERIENKCQIKTDSGEPSSPGIKYILLHNSAQTEGLGSGVASLLRKPLFALLCVLVE